MLLERLGSIDGKAAGQLQVFQGGDPLQGRQRRGVSGDATVQVRYVQRR